MTYSTSNQGNQIINKKFESKKISSFNIPNFFAIQNKTNNDDKANKKKVIKK